MTLAGSLEQLMRTRRLGATALVLLALAAFLAAPPTYAGTISGQTLRGTVESNAAGLPGYRVSLYASFVGIRPYWTLLGSSTSDRAGNFKIRYRLPAWLPQSLQPLLFVVAEDGPVMLASAIGGGPKVADNIVVNERTTVATGIAFAQFVGDGKILGNKYGMINAVHMAANLADPKTGDVGEVLLNIPNGTKTSTLPTFNSLTNAIASCVADDSSCGDLFDAATPPGGPAPTTVLQAVANIAKYPSYPGYPSDADDPLFQLSLLEPIYQPALMQRPTSWLLFIKFTGGFYSARDANNLLNGPGNFAIDERGFIWVNDNFVPEPPMPTPVRAVGS